MKLAFIAFMPTMLASRAFIPAAPPYAERIILAHHFRSGVNYIVNPIFVCLI